MVRPALLVLLEFSSVLASQDMRVAITSKGGMVSMHKRDVPAKEHGLSETMVRERGGSSDCTSSYYLVEHSFKWGKAKDWWAKFTSKDSPISDAAAWIEKQVKAGVYNSVFMPMKSGPMFCIWETKAGVSGGDLQKFIDEQLGFGMLNNKLMQIDPRGNPYPTVQSMFSDPTTALATTNKFATDRAGWKEKTTSTYYLVEHTFHWNKSDDWWKWVTNLREDQKWSSFQEKYGVYNTVFMPISRDGPTTFMYCIWEVKAGTKGEDLQNFVDKNVSNGMIQNRLMQIVSDKWMGPPVASQFCS